MDESKKESVTAMNIKQRLILLHSLPKEGDIVTIKILKELKMALGLSEDEISKLNISKETGNVNFDEIPSGTTDIPIGKITKGIIKSRLQELDTQKKLNEEHIELWDMFC